MKPRRIFSAARLSFSLAAALAALLATPSAQAAPIWWDGGTNNWATLSAWTTAAGAATPDATIVPGSADDLTFNRTGINTANIITLAANRAGNSLTFNSTGTSLFRANASGTTTARTLTIGAGGITLASGAGAVTIGDTPGTFGAINIPLAANQTWTNNSSNGFVIPGVVSGTGFNLTKAGTGIVRLNGVNTLTGILEVSSGILQIGSYTGLSTVSSLTVSAGGTSNLQLVQVGTGTTTNTITKALSLHGTLSIGGGSSTNRLNQTWAGTTTLAGNSTITNNGNSSFFITGPVDLGANALTYQADGTGSRINGNITGTGGSLIKTSFQDLTLFGTNTYTGTTTVQGGILRFVTQPTLYGGDDTKWTAANINVQSGATLAFNVGGTNQFTGANITTLLTNLAVSNSATEGMNAGSNFAFNTDTAPNFFSIPDVIADSTGASGGARGLIKQGAVSVLVLTGANTYTGATTISGGTLRLENTTASSQITLASSTTSLEVATDTAYSGPRVITTAGTIVADRATAGAGLTHAFSGVSRLGSGNTNITAGTNVTSGTAAIQFASLDNDNGTVAGFGLNPTTANVIVTGGVNMGGGANAGDANFTLTGTSTGNSIGGAIINGARVNANLIKSGTSTWALSGDSTYNGTTTINAGTLDLGGGTANGSLASPTLILAGGTFAYTRTGTNTQSFTTTNINAATAGLISVAAGNTLNLGTVVRGAGGWVDFSTTGAGIVAADISNNVGGIMPGFSFGSTWAVANGSGVAISGLNTYTLTSTAGTFAGNYTGNHIDVDNSAGLLDGPITTNSLRFSTAAANTLTLTGTPNVIASSGILVDSGVGANLSTITGGELTGAASTNLAVIQNNTSGGLTISSVIVNNTATGLTKSGAGLLTLAGANTYTGTTAVTAGTLQLSGAGRPGAAGSPVSVSSGALLDLNGTNQNITFVAGTGVGTVANNSGGGTSILTLAGTPTINGGLVTIVDSTTTPGGKVGVVITGNTQPMSSLNTYSGGTTVNGGAFLYLNSTSPMGAGTGAITLTAAGTGQASQLGSGLVVDSATYANDIDGLGYIHSNSSTTNIVTFTGNLTNSGPYIWRGGTVANNTFNFAGNGTTSVLSGVIGSATSQVNGAVSTGNVIKSGTGTLTLSGTNVYTGTTTISGGILNANSTSALGSGGAGNTLIFNGGTLQAGGAITSPAARTVTLTSTGLIDTNGNAVSIAGIMSGLSGLTKSGAGTLTLTGANTYTGATTIDGGNVLIGSGGTIANTASNTITINGSGTLTFGRSDTFGNHAANVVCPIVINAGGVVTNSGAFFNALGPVTLDGGTLTATGGASPTFPSFALKGTVTASSSLTSLISASGSNAAYHLGDGTVTGTTFDVAGGGLLTVSGNLQNGRLVPSPYIQQASSLTKTGAGTIRLSGINTYTGDTTVNAGTLELADDAQLKFVTGAIAESKNSITGTGTVTINGDFNIDTTLTDATALTTGTWTLVDKSTLTATFNPSFTLLGAGWSETADVWTKTVGSKKYTFTEADGKLTLSPSATYASWIDGFGLAGLDAAATADPDFDGISNAVEMVIGGNPATGMDTALLPTIELVTDPAGVPAGNYLLFTYRRTAVSELALVAASCETDTDLVAPWSTAINGASGVVILEDLNFTFTPAAPADTDRVRVYVPRGANTTLFGRLNVTVP